jgi:ureidoacrylate peracid hydrolase
MPELAAWEQEALAKLSAKLPQYELVPDKTALIIIDMQYLDAHPDYGFGKRAKDLGIPHLVKPYFDRCAAATGKIQELLQTARSLGVEVIHVVIAPYTSDARECGMVSRLLGYRPPKGSRETDILDELTPLDDEIVLPKITSSAFNSTPLDQILRNMEKDTLIVCGVVTNGCVETTVRDGRDFGYKIVMVSDACAAFTVEGHENTLKHMSGTRGNVRDTASIVAELNERKSVTTPQSVAPVPVGA